MAALIVRRNEKKLTFLSIARDHLMPGQLICGRNITEYGAASQGLLTRNS